MLLKPQDILVLLKLVTQGQQAWSYASLAGQLGMSASQLHAAIQRSLSARLAVREDEKVVPEIQNLLEFLAHGLRYVFIPEVGEVTRGVPTRYAAPPLLNVISTETGSVLVWPDPAGEVKGQSFTPLCKSVPVAARIDPRLYELLVLVDAIRGGSEQERAVAIRMLQQRLGGEAAPEVTGLKNDQDTLVIGGTIAVSRTALRQLAERYHIHRLELFGSAARGQLKPESDIDLLVEFEPTAAPSLWDAQQLQAELSQLLGGRHVVIVPPEILRNPFRRKTIEPELQVIYEAA